MGGVVSVPQQQQPSAKPQTMLNGTCMTDSTTTRDTTNAQSCESLVERQPSNSHLTVSANTDYGDLEMSTSSGTSGQTHGHGSQNHGSHTNQTQSYPTPKHVDRAGMFKISMVIVFFSASSLISIFVNKAVLTGFDFGFPSTVMLLQMAAANCFLLLMKMLGKFTVPKIERMDYLKVAAAASLWIANVLLGLYALKLVNIPMFSTLRRLSILFVMAVEAWYGKRYSKRILMSVIVTVVGSVLSAVSDLAFDPLGYILVIINNAITGLYFNSLKMTIGSLNLDSLQLYYYTSLVGLPLMGIMAAISDLQPAMEEIRKRPDLQGLPFIMAMVASAIVSFLVNYSTNLNVEYTTPLSTAISSVVKNTLQTIIGMASWGYVVTPLNVSGLLVALVGSSLFSYFKVMDNQAAMQKSEDPDHGKSKSHHGNKGDEGIVLVDGSARGSNLTSTNVSSATNKADD